MTSYVGASPWTERLSADRIRAARNQSAAHSAITDELLSRARESGALAFALTGSTARAERTAISDLDFHMIGERLDLSDLPGDVDLVSDSLERFRRRVVEGDDFAHWTLRFGCVLDDSHDVFRDADLWIRDQQLWPEAKPKFDRALQLGLIAERVLSIGDRDAGQEHVRGGLTSLARGLLLDHDVFPLARAELAEQLREADHLELAGWLDRTIYSRPDLDELEVALAALRRVARRARGKSVSRDMSRTAPPRHDPR